MQNQLNIRNARTNDAQLISDLIVGAAQYFNTHESSKLAEWFLKSITPNAIENYINDPKYNYLVAHLDQTLVGVIAIRESTHIHHLFVDPKAHRNGIAARLWERAKSDALNAGNNKAFFVRSSEYAVPVYEKFGFRVTGDRQEKDGIAFIPMRLEL